MALVPPRGLHLTCFHGVFAPNARLRRVVMQAPPRFDLRRVDAVGDDPRALRSFGYFGAQSALSQRTINESAEVAEALSR